MECSTSGYKTFLLCCNVALMFVGVSVLVLGVQMEQLLSALLLTALPVVGHSVRSVVATGVLVSLAACSGIVGVLFDGGTRWLILVHLFALGVIVVMEFAVGVALLVVRRTVENYIGSMECNTNCATTLDSIVLQYALPSAGLMLTIIIVEALMMYSAFKVLSNLRECPKSGESALDADVQMQSVASPLPHYSPHPDRTFTVSPNSHYPLDCNSDGFSPAQAWYTPDRDFAAGAAAKPPPHYASLPRHMQLPPPPYGDTIGGLLAPPRRPSPKRGRAGSCQSAN